MAAGDLNQPASVPPGLDPVTVIDLFVEAQWKASGLPVAPRCDDATFIRRLYLDVCGRIPTLEERDEFLAATDSGKRSLWIDRLLNRSEHARHMTDLFDGMLLGRRSRGAMRRRDEHGWREYLQQSFATNRPWNKMARDMILARQTEQTDVRGGWFVYEHRNQHQELAESVARNFFGVRVECAQCHDHPLADEILQSHYWGLVSFFNRSKNLDTDAGPRVAEDALGGFMKYTDLGGGSYETTLTFLQSPTVAEVRPPEDRKETDDDYIETEDEEPRVPKFSRRQQFVDAVLKDHPLLARAFVNRIWGLILGRGFVHPFDRMDSTHEASHPELLNWLSEDFRDSDYDTRRLLRNIMRSKCYQLDSRPADALAQPAHFSYAITKPLPAESLLRSVYVAVTADVEEPDPDLMQQFRAAFPDILADEPNTRLQQALLLTNQLPFNRLLRTTKGGTCDQMQAASSLKQRVDIAFHNVLGRSADADEMTRSVQFLRNDKAFDAAGGDAGRGRNSQLLWALITSAEFRLNH